MKSCLCYILFIFTINAAYADTIDRYMNIVDSIPKMEMKADPDAQVWVRSARNVIVLTCESIGETLALANRAASQSHHPLFCLPGNTQIDSQALNHLIQQTYRSMSSPTVEKDKMTVSEVALLGLTQKFPCTQDGLPVVTAKPKHALMSSSEMVHQGAVDTLQGFRP